MAKVLEYENFVVYTVYISTHLLCSVLQLIYVSDIYITCISRMMCMTVIVNCVVRSICAKSLRFFRIRCVAGNVWHGFIVYCGLCTDCWLEKYSASGNVCGVIFNFGSGRYSSFVVLLQVSSKFKKSIGEIASKFN
jgi:hypothetical protein